MIDGLTSILDSSLFRTLGIPLLIFLARVSDVSLGTLRMVAVSMGMKGRAAVLGFFEVLIWLTVIGYIFQNLTTIANYLAYAAGFATGNYLGLLIEERMAVGMLGVTVITNRDAREMVEYLRGREFGITSVSALGSTGRVRILLSVILRRHLEELRQIVERFHPNAFMTIQTVRSASKPLYPRSEIDRGVFQWWRKGK